MRRAKHLVLASIAVLVLSATAQAQNKCDSGKLKCIEKKTSCLLKVRAAALQKGGAPDAGKLTLCQTKFDDPGKGCIAKLEAKQILGKPETVCTVTGDVTTLESAVDDFVASAIDLVTGVKRVFVTSSVVAADFASVSNDGALAGDTICQQHADAAGLGGSWKAWLSDQATSPSVRFTHSNGPYQLVDGTRIADDWTDLTDLTLQNPIALDEHGAAAPASSGTMGGVATSVWTGTFAAGVNPGNAVQCSNWTAAGSGIARLGDTTSADAGWSARFLGNSVTACTGTAPLFCFEQ